MQILQDKKSEKYFLNIPIKDRVYGEAKTFTKLNHLYATLTGNICKTTMRETERECQSFCFSLYNNKCT